MDRYLIQFTIFYAIITSIMSIKSLLLYNNQTDNDKPVITIGFLSSFKYGLTLGKLIAGAIPLAVEDVNRYLIIIYYFHYNNANKLTVL
jgi:hypothetical protein